MGQGEQAQAGWPRLTQDAQDAQDAQDVQLPTLQQHIPPFGPHTLPDRRQSARFPGPYQHGEPCVEEGRQQITSRP